MSSYLYFPKLNDVNKKMKILKGVAGKTQSVTSGITNATLARLVEEIEIIVP